MTQESQRLDRLELKLDRLQEQSHQNHLELLDLFKEEVGPLKMKVDRHDSYFAMVLKALGLGGIITSWLSLKDLWPHK